MPECTLRASAILAIREGSDATAQKVAAFVFLTGVANLVIGFYFGRTNHQRTGGIGVNNNLDEGR